MNNSLNLMRARLKLNGGEAQQDRMIKDKRKTLDKVVLYSYQGAQVRKLNSETVEPALINPNVVKQDYDDKIISIGYEYDYKPGVIFDWINTGTKWLIYLQDLTELAYFKGNIRKCSYKINWLDETGKQYFTYAAIRGPVETKIENTIKHEISLDSPNYTLHLMLPSTFEVLQHFKRYSKFYIQPLKDGDSPICWRVEAIDTISTPGILEFTAVEYYANEHEDNIEQGIVDAWGEEIPQPQDCIIDGATFIKPKQTYEYEYLGSETPEWSYDIRLPIEATRNGNKITIKWTTTYTGQFVLHCGEYKKTIVVESLF